MEQRDILERLETGFPVASRPFFEIAKGLGITEEEVMEEARSRSIRRVQVVFNYPSLGYRGTLFGVMVEPFRVRDVAPWVNRYNGVTHNYLRDHPVNLWFTLIYRDDATKEDLTTTFRGTPGVGKIYEFPARKVFKIRAAFTEEGGKEATPPPPAGYPSIVIPLDEMERHLIRRLSEGIPVTPFPFKAIAESTRFREEEVVERLRKWLSKGVVRRVGASINHIRIGVKGNIMVVMRSEEGEEFALGRAIAGSPHVSHCYLRDAPPDFPFPLFAMFHARTMEECRERIEETLAPLPVAESMTLPTLQEIKKAPMVYFMEEAP